MELVFRRGNVSKINKIEKSAKCAPPRKNLGWVRRGRCPRPEEASVAGAHSEAVEKVAEVFADCVRRSVGDSGGHPVVLQGERSAPREDVRRPEARNESALSGRLSILLFRLGSRRRGELRAGAGRRLEPASCDHRPPQESGAAFLFFVRRRPRRSRPQVAAFGRAADTRIDCDL